MAKTMTAAESYTITVSLPPRVLWQNVRVGHWAQRSGPGGKHRHEAHMKTLAAVGCQRPLWVRAAINYRFFWPDKRRRDPANALAAMKWAQDGLVDAGLLLDDDKTFPTVTFDVDAENPRCEMVVTRG